MSILLLFSRKLYILRYTYPSVGCKNEVEQAQIVILFIAFISHLSDTTMYYYIGKGSCGLLNVESYNKIST